MGLIIFPPYSQNEIIAESLGLIQHGLVLARQLEVESFRALRKKNLKQYSIRNTYPAFGSSALNCDEDAWAFFHDMNLWRYMIYS